MQMVDKMFTQADLEAEMKSMELSEIELSVAINGERVPGSKSGEEFGHQSAEVAREKGVITFFYCSSNELSYEIDDLQHGAFTKALLEGLGSQGKYANVERLTHFFKRTFPW